jgi:hypothetical protein
VFAKEALLTRKHYEMKPKKGFRHWREKAKLLKTKGEEERKRTQSILNIRPYNRKISFEKEKKVSYRPPSVRFLPTKR